MTNLGSHLSSRANNTTWLLQRFVRETGGVQHAFAVSSDGLLITFSSNLTRQAADKLAAVITGLQSLAEGASTLLECPGLKVVILDLHERYLLVSTISSGAVLGVVASNTCDLGQVGYEMAFLSEQIGRVLTPDLIVELRSSIQE
jgi:predicted regulator of Ras-like GTPase activity (Roadblock/LC7/MglB family)